MKFIFVIVCVMFVLATIPAFIYIDNIQGDPYMDEIFHVPQARNYCSGNFSHWDPMITTLPGLYLTTVGLYKPVAVLLNLPLSQLCTVIWLRATNVLFAAGNFYLIFSLLRKLNHPLLDPDDVKVSMTTLALSCFPVLYFFTFLYYTDVGSTFFVLFMYLLSLHDSHWLAAAMGVMAVLFRQTNIIWVVFVAGLVVSKMLLVWTRNQTSKQDIKLEELSDYKLLKVVLNSARRNLLAKKCNFINLLLSIFETVLPYICVGLSFVIFIYKNNGIVVGDRTQHTVSLNFPQIFYFLSMANFFALFHLFSPSKFLNFLKFCFKHPLLMTVLVILSLGIVHYFTYEHKYLLSDNRHYTFYVWSKIYRRHAYVKYALVPGYVYFLWSSVQAIKHRDVFWKIIFALCVVMSTVPQKLLEFRYFILPYLIFRLNMRYGTTFALLHEILLYGVVNAATVYLFTQKPFRWSHEDGVQRFMW